MSQAGKKPSNYVMYHNLFTFNIQAGKWRGELLEFVPFFRIACFCLIINMTIYLEN